MCAVELDRRAQARGHGADDLAAQACALGRSVAHAGAIVLDRQQGPTVAGGLQDDADLAALPGGIGVLDSIGDKFGDDDAELDRYWAGLSEGGTVVVPFMKLETEEDREKLIELGQKIIDFFAENALEHERTGEMIERIGIVNFLEALEIPIDPNMVSSPRTNPYVRMDGWDEEVAKMKAAKQVA